MALLAASSDDLQLLVNTVVSRLKRGGLAVSVSKSKTMVLGDTSDSEPRIATKLGQDGNPMEQVEEFKYLGSRLRTDGQDKPQVKTCMGKAWGLFWKAIDMLKWKSHLPDKLRGQLFSTYPRSAGLWDASHWRLTSSITTRVNFYNVLTQMQGRGQYCQDGDFFRRRPHNRRPTE